MRSQESVAATSSVPCPGRLAAYLAAGVGSLMLVAAAEAAVVSINLGPTGFNRLGTNAGLSAGGITGVNNFPIAGPEFVIMNQFNNQTGLSGLSGATNRLQFAEVGLASAADPKNFSASQSVDSTSAFASTGSTYFRIYNGGWQTSPDFGAGSYMGFRFSTDSGANWNYGYIEVRWTWTGTASTSTFELLSAAYESTANTAILAGATPIPAPSALALLALGGGAFRRARARAA